MARLRILLAAVVLALLASACGDDTVVTGDEPDPTGETSPAPAPEEPAEDACSDGEWVLVDAGPFTMRIPADLVDQEPQGIDSLVGQYTGPTMEVFYDYGAYTNDFGDLVDAGAAVEDVTVDGFDGRLVVADAGTGWAERPMTALYVSTDDVDGFANALGLSVVHDDDDREVARCVTESVDFTLAENG